MPHAVTMSAQPEQTSGAPGADPAQGDDAPPGGAPLDGRSPEFVIQVSGVAGHLPMVRFVIETTPETEKYYAKQWLLGPTGNANHDSGVDIPCPADVTIASGKLVRIDLGVRVRSIMLYWNLSSMPGAPTVPPTGVPSAYFLVPRSSIAKTEKKCVGGDPGRPQRVLMMPNSPGTIDSNYIGNLMVQLYNPGPDPVTLKQGEAVVQVVHPTLMPAEYCSCMRGGPLSRTTFADTERGGGGFGSTGTGGGSTLREARAIRDADM
jgi:dUTPase